MPGQYTVTVTVVRPGGRDQYGDPTGTPAETPVSGCVVWPEASSEQTFQQDIVALGYQVLMPAGTDVLATDQVRLPDDDLMYEVVGEPQRFLNPFTGTDPGVLVTARRSS
jgi:hypothetical protein